MTEKQNIRFFLALGNQKMVVLQHAQGLEIYADEKPVQRNVSVRRVAAVLQPK